jgi:hypothetical protein
VTAKRDTLLRAVREELKRIRPIDVPQKLIDALTEELGIDEATAADLLVFVVQNESMADLGVVVIENEATAADLGVVEDDVLRPIEHKRGGRP